MLLFFFFFFESFFESHQSTNSSLELTLMPTPSLFPVSLWNIPESSNHLEKQRGTLALWNWTLKKDQAQVLTCVERDPAWDWRGSVWHGGELSLLSAPWNESLRDFLHNSESPALPSPLFYPKFPRHMLQAFLTAGSLAAVWTARAPAALSSFSILSASSFLPYFILGLGICLRGRSQARVCWFK